MLAEQSEAKVANVSRSTESTWASALGIVMIVMGVLLAAAHGNEWMKHSVLTRAAPTGELPAAVCPEDELEEEGLTVIECEHMVRRLEGLILATPQWFPDVLSVLAPVGALGALATILIGSALVTFRRWAPRAAAISLFVLLLVDFAVFVAALKAGPIIRDLYLWDALLWMTIHLILIVGSVVGLRMLAPDELGPTTQSQQMRGHRFSASAVVLHWALAVSILFLFVSSWWMLALPLPSKEFRFREFPFQLHKNIGITLVVLLGVLLYLRRKLRPLPEQAAVSPNLRRFTRIAHIALYVLIVACCVSGYLSSSYSGWGTELWWMIELPYWGREDERLNMLYSDIHLWTCWALLVFVAAHSAGAVYHAFRNDGGVRRMLHL